MSAGGNRPGTGRPAALYQYDDGRMLTLKEIMAVSGLTYRQAYEQYRKRTKPAVMPDAAFNRDELPPSDIQVAADLANLSPLEYMLSVIRDPGASQERRDRMAQAAAPYLHPKADTTKGKKDAAKEKAAEAGKGKFAAGQAPKLVKFGRK